jgi:hypothetical protein
MRRAKLSFNNEVGTIAIRFNPDMSLRSLASNAQSDIDIGKLMSDTQWITFTIDRVQWPQR